MSTPARKAIGRFVAQYETTAFTLDLGAGPSFYGALFPNRIALDIRQRMGITLQGDAHKLPFRDGAFEVLLCTEVLEHLQEPFVAVPELYRVLAPGGRLILTTRFCYQVHDAPHDYFRFTRFPLEYLFRAWDIQHLVPDTSPTETVSILSLAALSRFPRYLRWPLRAALVPIWRVWEYAWSRGNNSASANEPFTSGYLLVAVRPATASQ